MRKKDKDADRRTGLHRYAGVHVVTAADIQSKEFSVSRFGGYRMRDVDEFLDHITESMTKLIRRERATAVRDGPARSRHPIGAPDLADTSRQADEIIETRPGGGGHDRAGRAAQVAAAAVGRRRSRDGDRCRSRRRRSVPVAGAGLPSAVGRAGPVARRVREGHGEGEPGRSPRPRRLRPSRQTPAATLRRRRRARHGTRSPAAPTSDATQPMPRSVPTTTPPSRPGIATGDGVADPRGGAGDGLGGAGDVGRRRGTGRRRRPDAAGVVLGRGVTRGDRRDGVALVVRRRVRPDRRRRGRARRRAVVSGDGLRLPSWRSWRAPAALLLLWLGVVRRSGSPPSAG